MAKKSNDRLRGQAGKDRLIGAAGADTLLGAGGNDSLQAGAGKDVLRGHAGRDVLAGGKGADSFNAGGGADRLNAVDKRADRLVNGGAGRDTCRIDSADLSKIRNCETVTVVPVTAPPNGGGLSPPGSSPGSGGSTDQQLTVVTGDGLVCASALPLCAFTITGNGADGLGLSAGVTGENGVILGADTSLNLSELGQWVASGLYGCTESGFIKVTVGDEQVNVPITCQ